MPLSHVTLRHRSRYLTRLPSIRSAQVTTMSAAPAQNAASAGATGATGTTAPAAAGQPAGQQDYLDKAVAFGTKKAGHATDASTTEKISDGIRGGFKKMFGKDIPIKYELHYND